MSATSQYKTFSDLYTGLLNAVRADTAQTVVSSQAKRYINTALMDMHIGFGEKFPWAERNNTLVTHPEYKVGTVTVTQGSTTLAGTGTSWDTNNVFGEKNLRVGGKVRIGGGFETYEITAVASDTSATLNHRFTQEDLTDTAYSYFEDQYALEADFLRPIDIQQFSDNIPIDIIDRLRFRRAYPRNYIVGRPTVATLIDLPPSGDVTPVRKVRFFKPPDIAYSIPYAYVTSKLVVTAAGVAATSFINDDDEPIVPLPYRHAILFHALYHWYRDRKNDTRSQEAKQEYTDLILRLTADVEVGAQRMAIKPASGIYRRKARRPYRGHGNRRFDINGRFDRFED